MKKILLSFVVLLTILRVHAQEQEKEAPKKGFQKENMFLGGNFGLSFGDYTFINISPQLGYRFNRYFAAGIGLNAQHVGYKDRDYESGSVYHKVSQTVFGLNVFGRVYPIRNIMLQVQPEANYLFGKETYYVPQKQQYNLDAMIVPSLLAGGGVVLPSGRGELLITLFYDVLQNQNSPYGRRGIFNFGYNIGF